MEVWLLSLIRGLHKQGHDISVVCPSDCDSNQIIEAGANRVFVLESFECDSEEGRIAVTESVLAASLKTEANIVHASQAGLSFLARPLDDAGFPFVVTAHGTDVSRTKLWKMDEPIRSDRLREYLGMATRVTAVSRFTRNLALESGAPPHTPVIPPAVDSNLFQPGAREDARRHLGLGVDETVVLSVGRLVPRKGLTDVVSALGKLTSIRPHYLVAGVGPEEGSIRRQAEAAGISDRVHLMGRVSAGDLRRLYDAADLFTLPVYDRMDENGYPDVEGFGIVFLEAAATATPVLATRAGGVPDAVVDGVTGRLVDPRDVEALCDQFHELLVAAPENALAMGAAGRQRIEAGFTIEHMSERFANLYAGIRSPSPGQEPKDSRMPDGIC